jgi:hypothetical protein
MVMGIVVLACMHAAGMYTKALLNLDFTEPAAVHECPLAVAEI